MKNVKKLIAAALISVLVVSTAGCKMIGKTQAAIDNSPVATVNKDSITRAELIERLNPQIDALKQQGLDPTTQEGKDTIKQTESQVLDSMVMTKIVMQKAKDLNIYPKQSDIDTAVNSQIDTIKGNYKTSDGKFDQTKFDADLKANDLTLDELKAIFTESFVEQKVKDYLVKDIKITDDQVKSEYDQNASTKYTTQPNTMRLSHILCASETDALAAKARLDKGEDFAKVAKDVSTDTGTKDAGGDLGDVQFDGTSVSSGGQLDATFMKAALTLKAGQISNPVQTQFGYHIIKCVSIKTYPVKSFASVKDTIKADLLQAAQDKKVNDTYAQWKSAATIVTDKYTSNLPY